MNSFLTFLSYLGAIFASIIIVGIALVATGVVTFGVIHDIDEEEEDDDAQHPDKS